ncbi:MAG: polysaccharide biosynthesis tyrosine autokinase [Actinomycetota bacterium]
MELRDYLNVITRRKWIIVGVTLAVVAAVLIFSLLQKPRYESRVTILAEINRASESATQTLYSLAIGDPNTFIQTQAKIIRTRTLAKAVRERLEYLYQEAEYDRREGKEVFIPASLPSTEQMLATVKVDRTQNTNVFQIIYTDHDPLLARDIAQAYADEYIEERQLSAIKQISEARKEVWNRISELETQIQDIAQRVKQYTKETIPPELEAEASQAVNLWATLYEKYMSLRIAEALEQRGLEMIEPAEVGEKVSPRTTRNAVLALFLGLILGVGLVFLADYLDVTLKTREDFEQYYGVPVIGEIARFRGLPEEEREIMYFSAPDSTAAEGFRNLRTNLQFLNLEGDTRLVMVTSASPGEGKTSVAANLGAALSEMGKRVLVVEADLRQPTLDEFIMEKPAKGVTEVLAGTAGVEEAVTQAGNSNLYFMTCGMKPPNPAEMVSSQAMRDLLGRLREEYDYVIVDSPPVLSVSDPVAMAPMMEGIILVASHGIAEREAAQRTVELLSKVNARILGLVINNLEATGRYGYGYYYSTYYRYSYEKTEKGGKISGIRRRLRKRGR